MDKREILVTIHEMRGEYAHKVNEELKRIGKIALEDGVINLNPSQTRPYHEAQAKVCVLDELIETCERVKE